MSEYSPSPHLISLGPSLPPKEVYTIRILDPTIISAIRTGQIYHQCLQGSIDFLAATSNYEFPSKENFQLGMSLPFYSTPRQGSYVLRAVAQINKDKPGNPMPPIHVGVRPQLLVGMCEWKIMFEHTWDYTEDVGKGWRVEVSFVRVEITMGGREIINKAKVIGRLFVPGKYNPEPVSLRKVYKNGIAGMDGGCIGVEASWGVDKRVGR